MIVRLHALLPRSRANGPDLRFVLWLQGCTRSCPGCFNPGAQSLYGGEERDISEVLAELAAVRDIEGVTFSGGEPLQQPEALFALAAGAQALGLGVVLFSGYTHAEILCHPSGRSILEYTDTLIAGPYDAARRNPRGLVGSDNQRIHHLSPRYAAVDFTRLPARETIIRPDGAVIHTGVNPIRPTAKEE